MIATCLSTAALRTELDLQGFAILRGAIPEDLLHESQTMMEIWIEHMINNWIKAGKLSSAPNDTDFRSRFLRAWNDAGKPSYHRSPRGELVSLDGPRMFRLLGHSALVAIARQALECEDIVSHGIWNSRPKAPDQRFTDTPWHQDAQYFPDEPHARMVDMWFPLHDVDADSSCLAFCPQRHHDGIFPIHEDAEGTGFLGLTPADAAHLESVPVPLRRGDVVVFTNLTPHHALPNRTPLMRWSFDLRFTAGDSATALALDKGFRVGGDSYADWRTKWD